MGRKPFTDRHRSITETPRSWSHRRLRQAAASLPHEDIAYHVARATADTLRRAHGIPDLPALGAQLHQASSGSPADWGSGNSPRVLPTHIPTRLARQAADALSVVMKDRLALTSPDSAALMLARRVVAEIAYTFGLDRMAPILVAGGLNPAELQHRFENIAQSNPLGELARRLLAHPDANGLARQRWPKLATADLIDVDVREML